ncbi:MAG TPA: response regulator transcription factor [Streptosporangiaceae bacterium]|jgi:DNA-binding NarL/FixJ family response regulator|nr:response regulator transcription factor [Streptosporangiaceae bacterium]
MATRVLVCDALPVVREGMRTVLAAEPDIEVVGTTDSGIEALVMTRRLHPHVVITDATLSGLSGVELTRRLQREPIEPAPSVLVFTPRDDDVKIMSFLEAGAMGLVVKETGTDEMATAVRVVAAGEAMLAPCVSRKLLDWFFERAARPNGQVNLAVAGLSPREREVLGLVARGMSGLEIAKELQITEATVRTHIYRIRHKLELRNRAQLVAFAYRNGLAPAA